MKKRILTFLLAILLMTSLSATTFADNTVVDNQDIITIGFTSDTHNTGDHMSSDRLAKWIETVATKQNDMLDIMTGCGDYAGYKSYFRDYWDRVEPVFDEVDNSEYITGVNGKKGIFVAGNHDWLNGNLALSFNSTAKRIHKKRGIGIETEDYDIYCFGASSTFQLFDSISISGLESYLKKSSPSNKPLFIISHYPLHKTSERSMTNAGKVVNLLNKYSDKRNIFFIWGHNHTDFGPSDSEHNYDKIFAPGAPIDNKGGYVTYKFTYAAAGCMSDKDYASGAGRVKGKGLVASYNKTENTVILEYYGYAGENREDIVPLTETFTSIYLENKAPNNK